jgi:signal transduction histidine kinase/ActR/RegA family two-component response regulator
VATFDGWLTLVHPDDRDRVAASLASTQARADTVTAWEEVYRFQRADGTWADVHDRGYVSRTAQGEVVRMIGAMEDVTAQRQLEARLRQAQKMEAIGQLAGGIAHDFNNLLTVIGGSLEFARDGLPVDHAVRPDLEEIAAATERARTLVRQLLTFSRQQTVQPRLVQVSEVVHGMERLLRRVIGEEITLHVIADYDKAPVRIDPGQLEQVLMNLAVNARDAMLTPRFGHPGSGGSLTIEVSRTVAASPGGSSATTTSAGGERRRCVQLVVRDTGHGIDADTRAHLFEPFFTTKDVGSGTGLGLATVHGIVTQAGGTIHVDSAPGAGAAFTILLPEADLPAERTTPRRPLPVVPAMPATVLVVEDEAPVRAVVRRTLERHGLQVLEARHGVDALLLWRRNRDDIRVVLTDVRMPEMGGHELAAALRRERPDLPVIFVSGYADHAATEVLGAFDRFVEKPFTSEALLAALVDVLRDSATPLRG